MKETFYFAKENASLIESGMVSNLFNAFAGRKAHLYVCISFPKQCLVSNASLQNDFGYSCDSLDAALKDLLSKRRF